ncbi:hypothetical protein FOZ63_018457, partial [Perkinsus olseni]
VGVYSMGHNEHLIEEQHVIAPSKQFPSFEALTSTRLMFEILQLTFILVVNHLEAASLKRKGIYQPLYISAESWQLQRTWTSEPLLLKFLLDVCSHCGSHNLLKAPGFV